MKLKKSAVSKNPTFSKEGYFNLAEEYKDLSAKIKSLDERKKQLSALLKEGAQKYGVEDDKGSFYLENDSFLIGRVAKRSFKLDQDKAVSMLEEMGLEDIVDVITTKVVNEDRLNEAVAQGKLTLDDVEQFTNVTTSFMVDVRPKENPDDMKSVEVSAIKMAARRK